MTNLTNRLSPFAKWLLSTWNQRPGLCEWCGKDRILNTSTGLCGPCVKVGVRIVRKVA